MIKKRKKSTKKSRSRRRGIKKLNDEEEQKWKKKKKRMRRTERKKRETKKKVERAKTGRLERAYFYFVIGFVYCRMSIITIIKYFRLVLTGKCDDLCANSK